VTITEQLDLAFNPFEKRGAHGEWGAGAELKAHDTASATAAADARAKLAADWDAKRAERKAVPRHYVGVKPAPGKAIMMVDPDRPSEIAYVRRHPMVGHVDVEHADGRHEVMPAQFIDHPMLPNMFHGGSPVRGAPNTLAAAVARSETPPVTPADPADADSPVSKQLDADFASGIKEAQSPRQRAAKAGLNVRAGVLGNSADTSVVTFGNGHQWIRKRGLDEDEMHREVLVSRISDVLGAGAPQVTLRRPAAMPGGQREDQEMWEPMVPNAVVAGAWLGDQNDPGNKHDLYDMVSSQAGVKMGILDTITDNDDRHEGNWMVQTDPVTGRERPVPIDHGRAMMGDKRQAEYGGTGPFGQHLFAEGQESEQLAAIPADAWASWIHRIDLLSPQFREYGMSRQLENVQGALEIIMKMSARARKQMPRLTGQPFTPDAPELWTGPTE
jgi:hypothetical protein